jgi:hypothetical protein
MAFTWGTQTDNAVNTTASSDDNSNNPHALVGRMALFSFVGCVIIAIFCCCARDYRKRRGCLNPRAFVPSDQSEEAATARTIELASRLKSIPAATFAAVVSLAAKDSVLEVDSTCAICLSKMELVHLAKRLVDCHHWYATFILLAAFERFMRSEQAEPCSD